MLIMLTTLMCLLAMSSGVLASFGTTLCPSAPSNLLKTFDISSKCPTYLLSSRYQLQNFSAINSMECAVLCNNAGMSLFFRCGVDSASFNFRCYGMNQFCLAVFPVSSCLNGLTQPDGSCVCHPGFYGRFCEKYFKSCIEVYVGNDGVVTNGIYTFETEGGVSITAKCEFRTDHILTFFNKTSLTVMTTEDLARHYNDACQFVLRHKYIDTNQKDSVMEQITAYNSYNLTFSLNQQVPGISVNQSRGEYLYIEFAPIAMITAGVLNGYKANGIDYSFTNCDANPNSFIALYPNLANLAPAEVGLEYVNYSRNWEFGSQLVDITDHLTDDFFMMFDISFGGCGCKTFSTWWPDIVGFNAGFRYVIPV